MFDKLLTDIYYNVKHPASYSSAYKLFKAAKKENSNIKLKDVKKFLSSEKTYTLHHPIFKKKIYRRKTITRGLNDQFQVDLADMTKYANYNSNYRFILTAIDCFSRYAFCIPLKRKTGVEVRDALKQIFLIRKPNKIQADKGTEFWNHLVVDLLNQHNIKLFATQSDTKASLIERFNRTIKGKMGKHFTKTKSYKYIDVLQDLVSSYNNSKHRTIGMAPINVTKENERELWKKLYGEEFPKEAKFRFEINDKVRITKLQNIFAKSYLPLWTEEYFIIKYRFATNPPTYKITDLKGELIDGSFYEKELQKINKSESNDLYDITILKTRKSGNKKQHFVHYEGWPSSFDEWIDDRQIAN